MPNRVARRHAPLKMTGGWVFRELRIDKSGDRRDVPRFLKDGSAVPTGREGDLGSRSRRWKRRAIVGRPYGTWIHSSLLTPDLPSPSNFTGENSLRWLMRAVAG